MLSSFAMSFLDRLATFVIPDLSTYLQFRVAGQHVGFVDPSFADRLAAYPAVFSVGAGAVTLSDDMATPEHRSASVETSLRSLNSQGHVPGWRDEHYRVSTEFDAPQLFSVERAAAPLLGVHAYGVHVNGYVRDGADIHMWVGCRASDRGIAPGKLDQVAAGGQPAHLSVAENLIKECGEEASIPPELAQRARSVGAITYAAARPEGLRRDVLFTYDLEIPADFQPINIDGETASFQLLPLKDVAAIVRDTDDFKFNCALVVIDFLVRHGRFGPDDPDFEAIVRGMHQNI